MLRTLPDKAPSEIGALSHIHTPARKTLAMSMTVSAYAAQLSYGERRNQNGRI